MTITETGSDQGWAERVNVVERYRGGSRAWAARGATHTRANYAWTKQNDKGPAEEDALRKNEDKMMRPKRPRPQGRATIRFPGPMNGVFLAQAPSPVWRHRGRLYRCFGTAFSFGGLVSADLTGA